MQIIQTTKIAKIKALRIMEPKLMKAVLVLQDHQIMKKMKTPTAISNSHANKELTHIKENVSSVQLDLAGMEPTVSRE